MRIGVVIAAVAMLLGLGQVPSHADGPDFITVTGTPAPYTNLKPGDVRMWVVTVTNSGLAARASLRLGPAQTALGGDPGDGLQLRMQTCTSTWVSTPSGYACEGVLDTKLDGAVSVLRAEPQSLGLLPADSTVRYLVRVEIPLAAGNGVQGVTETLGLRFVATEVGAEPEGGDLAATGADLRLLALGAGLLAGGCCVALASRRTARK